MTALLPRLLRACAAMLPLLAAGRVCADPGYYLLVPYDQAGRQTAEFRYWTVKSRNRPEKTWPELGLAHGVNPRWTTTLFASWLGRTNRATRLSTLNWQNTVLLTQGQWPLDIAWHGQLIHETEAHDTSVEQGLLLQTEFGFVRVNLNLVFERRLDAGAPPTELKLQWQLRRRVAPATHVGLLGFDELGPWQAPRPHARQSHRLGPMFDTTWRQADDGGITLQAGWLVGKTYGRSGHMLTLRSAATF